MKRTMIIFLCLGVWLLAACRSDEVEMPIIDTGVTETSVVDIPLTAPISDPNAEISGLAWYGDTLILLPQYPDFAGNDPAVYGLPKADIKAFLNGSATAVLEPIPIPFKASNLADSIKGFEGYEAIAFVGDTVYLTIEASGDGMQGYVVQGTIAPDLSVLKVDTTTLTRVEPQANLDNMSEEGLLIVDNTVMTFYEANGIEVNESPVVHLFDMNLTAAGTAVFPNIPYRITDVTELDDDGRFWAINYNFPGSEIIQTDNDPLAAQYGEGSTHTQSEGVERLVEFQYTSEGITLIEQPPIQLQLLDEDLRNWEGIVRLDEQGFLLVTDKFPTTILGFVPLATQDE